MYRKFTLYSLLTLLFWASLPLLCYGEQRADRSDSLRRILEELPQNAREQRLELMISLGRSYHPHDPDSAMIWVERAEALSEQEGHRKGLISSLNLKGIIHYSKGEYSKALSPWKRILKIKEEEGEASSVSHIRNNLGLLYQKLGAYLEALEQHQEAYRIRDSLGMEGGVAESANNLGNVHYERGELEKAESYYREALRIRKDKGEKGALSSTYNNLGLIHRSKGEHEEAIELFRKALDLELRRGRPDKAGIKHLNLAFVFQMMEEWDSVGHHIQKGRSYYKKVGNQDGVLSSYIDEVEYLRGVGKLDRALEVAKRAERMSDSLSSLPRRERVSGLLAELYEEKGDHRRAYRYLELHEELSDSLMSRDKEERIRQLEARFQAEQKEKELERMRMKRRKAALEREQILIISGGVGVLLLLLVAFIYFAYRQKKRSIELLSHQNQQIRKQKEEKELLLQELQHRVKNNLQLILSLLNLQTDRIKDEEAQRIHQDSQNRVRSMGMLHERMYRIEELDKKQFEEFVRELAERLIETYGMEDRVKLDIDVNAEGLGTDTLTPLALILNELLSNCLKYAFGTGEEGRLAIRIGPVDEESYILEVQDDGNGFEGDPGQNNGQAFGLDIVHSLAEQLDGELKKKSAEKGTCMQVSFRNVDR